MVNKILKKKDLIINYYNIVYKYSKFHNKIYYFLKYLDIGGKFLSFNYLKKIYRVFYDHKDFSLFFNTLGNIKNKEDLKKKNEKNHNLKFINFFHKNKNLVLRYYSNAKLNFKILKDINDLNHNIYLNNNFNNSLLFKDKSIDFNYFNLYIFLINKFIASFFKNYLKFFFF